MTETGVTLETSEGEWNTCLASAHENSFIARAKRDRDRLLAELARLKARPTSEEVETAIARLSKAEESFRFEVGTFDDLNVLNDIVVLLRRLAAQSDGWRLIETAEDGADTVLIGRPGFRALAWRDMHGVWWHRDLDKKVEWLPTHWQRAPSPPSPPSTEDK